MNAPRISKRLAPKLQGPASPPAEPDLKRALSRVMKMMAIPGPSGHEAKIVQFIVDELRRAGAPAKAIKTDSAHKRSRIGGDVGNLILKLPGTRPGPGPGTGSGARRLLMAHVDTVPLCVGCKPVQRRRIVRSADRNTALGADNRSGAAAVLTGAVEILRQRLPHPPVTFLFPVQEEIGLAGVPHASLTDLGKPAMGFNFDGGMPHQVVVAAKGAYRITFEVQGIASHAGVHPEDGASAIAIAALAIAQLQRDGWHGLIRKGSQTGTSNVGLVEGGSAVNVVAPTATVRAEARSHDPRFRKRILDTMVKAFAQAAQSVRGQDGRCGKVNVSSSLDYESFKLGPREPCVAVAENVIRGLGLEPIRVVVNGGLDANVTSQRGIPTVTLGAGQHHPHTVDELLNVKEFENGCRLALRLASMEF